MKTWYKINKLLKNIKKDIVELKNIKKNDKNFKELCDSEIRLKKLEIKNIRKKNKFKKNKIIMEIKPAVGGKESELFIVDLKKMYVKYFKKKNWKVEILNIVTTNFGGIKELVLYIKGCDVYKYLKFESGLHRVQRLPLTENKGRLHTSACRVAVYKKKKLLSKELKKSELKIDFFKSSGAGGQHVNTTDSAVRIKHLPTGLTVECQKERSQHKNKNHALKSLKLKLNSINIGRNLENIKILKNNLLGKGFRSEKIRTYNYKNNKIIDHRFKFELNKLDKIIKGRFDLIIKKLKSLKILS